MLTPLTQPPHRDLTVIHPADPAAGADIDYTVPAHTIIVPVHLEVRLTTSVAAANRLVSLRFTRGGVPSMSVFAQLVQTASLTWFYEFAAGLNSMTAATLTTLQVGLPLYWVLHPTDILTVLLTAGDAADQLSDCYLHAWQYPTA